MENMTERERAFYKRCEELLEKAYSKTQNNKLCDTSKAYNAGYHDALCVVMMHFLTIDED